MVKLITQVVLRGQNIDSLPLQDEFKFEKFENDYALININGKNENYLIDLKETIDKLYYNKECFLSNSINSKELILLFSYKNQGNIEFPVDIMKKIIELNFNLSISFYESK